MNTYTDPTKSDAMQALRNTLCTLACMLDRCEELESDTILGLSARIGEIANDIDTMTGTEF